jgi:hypothetical protein
LRVWQGKLRNGSGDGTKLITCLAFTAGRKAGINLENDSAGRNCWRRVG